MRTRAMRDEDIPRLKELYREAGYDYELPNLLSEDIVDVTVVVDENDAPVAAALAVRSVELFLLMGKTGHPLVKMQRVGALHHAMRENLAKKGYRRGNAFLPPSIAASWGRHLEKWFGWLKNNPSYEIRG